MAQDTKPESTFLLWLEEALPGWILPVLGIGSVLAVVLLFNADILSDRVVALMTAAVFAGGLGYAHLIPAAQSVTRPAARAVVLIGTGVSVALALYGFQRAAFPGDPVASATLTPDQKVLSLPASGSYRLLVSGHLGGSGETKGDYELRGSGGVDIRDSLQRSLVRRSFKRGVGVTSTQAHTQKYHDVRLADPARIELGHLGPELRGELTVSAFRALPVWVLIVIVIATLLSTAAADAVANAKGRCALVGGAAVTFALFLGEVSPDRIAGPTFGATLLAIAVGAVWSTLAPRVARRLIPGSWTDRGSKSADREAKRDSKK